MNELDWKWVHEGEAGKYMEQLNRKAAIKRKSSVRKNKAKEPTKLSKIETDLLLTSGNLPDWTGIWKSIKKFFSNRKSNV